MDRPGEPSQLAVHLGQLGTQTKVHELLERRLRSFLPLALLNADHAGWSLLLCGSRRGRVYLVLLDLIDRLRHSLRRLTSCRLLALRLLISDLASLGLLEAEHLRRLRYKGGRRTSHSLSYVLRAVLIERRQRRLLHLAPVTLASVCLILRTLERLVGLAATFQLRQVAATGARLVTYGRTGSSNDANRIAQERRATRVNNR